MTATTLNVREDNRVLLILTSADVRKLFVSFVFRIRITQPRSLSSSQRLNRSCYRLTPGRSAWKEREPGGKAAGPDIEKHGRKATIPLSSRAAFGARETAKVKVRGVSQEHRCKYVI